MSNKKLISEIDISINEIVNTLLEFQQLDDGTVVWDLTKDKIKKSTSRLKTPKQVEEYLIKFFDKTKNLPKKLRIKLSKYVLASLIGISSVTSLKNVVTNEAPEIKDYLNITAGTGEKEDDEEKEEDDEKKEDKEEKSNKEKEKESTKKHKTPTKVSDSLVNFLKHEEGSIRKKGEPVLTAYNIGDGAITVGWGHATKVKDSNLDAGDTITRKQANNFLKSDIKWAEDRLNSIINNWKKEGVKTEITQSMYDAMVSLIFNMGIGNFRKKIGKDFLQYVKDGKLNKAKEEILSMSSNLYKRYPGIKKRREKESEMFLSAKEKSKNSKIVSESYRTRMKQLSGLV